MVELFQKKTLQRSMKPTPLISLIRGSNKKDGKKDREHDVRLQSLGSGVTLPISPSLVVTPEPTKSKVANKPERTVSMPSTYNRNRNNSNNNNNNNNTMNNKKSREQRQSWISYNDRNIPSIQSRFSYCQSPPIDTFYDYNNNPRYSYYGGGRPLTPVLSPTSTTTSTTSDRRHSFYGTMRSPMTPGSQTSLTEHYVSKKSRRRSSNWKPVPSISSSEDDDDEVPLGKIGIIPEGIESLSLVQKRKKSTSSLLSNTYDEDGDDDLVPIGSLLSSCNSQHMSAAEKYKARVQAKLNMSVVI